MADNGTNSEPIPFDLPEWMAISAFTALAWYNVLQLNVSIFLTFKRRRGLYFWSLLVSGYGVIFHSVGFLLKLFALTHLNYLSIGLITVGWWSMVTGQSLVLYSRLHLVVKEQRILRGVLFMIIWNAVTLHLPTTVLTFGSNSPDWERFVPVFNIYERIQMTIFSLQELVISSIYLWAAFRLLKPIYRQRIRSVMMQLLWVNLIMVGMDISILAMEYLGYYPIEATLKSMIYAIKLVLEFAVLNQLMRLANSSRTNRELQRMNEEHTENDNWGGEPRMQRKNRWGSLARPGRAYFNDRTSISTNTDGETARIGSIAKRNESVSESQHDYSALFAPKKDHRHIAVPDLIIDPKDKEWSSDFSPTTIVNNPAAFSPEYRKRTDPFSLDGLTPSCSEIDLPIAAKTGTTSTFDRSIDPFAGYQISPTTNYQNSRTADASEIESQDVEKQAGSNTTAHAGLLRSRRASVSEFANDDGDTSEDCETDPTEPAPEKENNAQRHSAALSARGDGITPPWLAGEEMAVSDSHRLSIPPSPPQHIGNKRSSAGGAHFAAKALQSIQHATPHRWSHQEPVASQVHTTANERISTEFGHTGVRHSFSN